MARQLPGQHSALVQVLSVFWQVPPAAHSSEKKHGPPAGTVPTTMVSLPQIGSRLRFASALRSHDERAFKVSTQARALTPS
jgi:hypothetical protein